MNRFLVVIVVLVVLAVALGFYRGWFNLSSDGASENSNVTLTVDQEKIDKDKASVQNLGQKEKEPTVDPNE